LEKLREDPASQLSKVQKKKEGGGKKSERNLETLPIISLCNWGVRERLGSWKGGNAKKRLRTRSGSSKGKNIVSKMLPTEK